MKKSLLQTTTGGPTPTDPFGDGSGVSYFTFDSNTNSFDGTGSIGGGSATRSTSVKKHGSASLDLTANVWYRQGSIPGIFRASESTDRTYTFWVRVNSAQNGSPINFSSYYVDGARSSFNITSSNVTQITWYNGSSYLTVHGATLTTGVWYFIGITLSGNGNSHATMQLWVNSTKYTTTSTSGSIGAWIERGIGKDHNAGYFNGYMDTLRGFNRILTDSEVSYIYNNDAITS